MAAVEAMRCMEGHHMSLSHYGHFMSRECSLCHGDIPRVAPRHRCWRCHYYLCYDCAVHLSWTKGSGTPLSKSLTGISEESNPCEVVGQLHQRVQRKQECRQLSVAISKEHDVADPLGGAVRTMVHNRRRHGIAEDCRFVAYSGDRLALQGAAEAPRLAPPAALASSPELSQGIALAALVLQKTKLLATEVIGEEVRDREDGYDQYWQPRLPGTAEGAQPSLLAWMLGGGDLAAKLQLLCRATKQILESQPIVTEVAVPAKIFGDIHGQFRDLLLLFHFYGGPDPGAEGGGMSYVFNGDWVDRGHHQLETLAFLLALKILYPERVWLNRGNHEDLLQNKKVTRDGFIGFDKACNKALGITKGLQTFEIAHKTFDWLPLAARIGGRILVLHGGLGDGTWTLDQLRSVERPLQSHRLERELNGVVYNVLWSDPLLADRYNPIETFGAHQSPRSQVKAMQNFGRDVTERFCKREGLGMVVRSHQFKRSGRCFELMHDGWLMRVFSARNYCGRHFNDGGFLLVGSSEASPSTLLLKPQSVERLKCTDPEVANGQLEPYCPCSHLMQAVRKDPGPITDCIAFFAKAHVHNLCDECSQIVDQDGLYFVCRGCTDYRLCVNCATANIVNSRLPADDSDDSDADLPGRPGAAGLPVPQEPQASPPNRTELPLRAQVVTQVKPLAVPAVMTTVTTMTTTTTVTTATVRRIVTVLPPQAVPRSAPEAGTPAQPLPMLLGHSRGPAGMARPSTAPSKDDEVPSNLVRM